MPLRVLHLFAQYLHPTENWCYQLLRHLPDSDVLVGSRYFLKHDFYDPRFTFVEFPFRAMDLPRRTAGDRLLNAVISHLLLPLYPRFLERYARPVDLLHAHFGYVGWNYLPTARRLGAPLVVSFYGADYTRLPQEHPVWRARYQAMFRRMALALCEGEHGRQQLIRLGCPPDKVRVLHLGVETSSIAARPPDKPARQLRLVQVATLREKKGHLYTVRAFREAWRDCPGISLTLVGADAEGLRAGLERELGEARAAVTFIDRIELARLHEFLRRFDVFIHPSVHAANGDCEGGAPVVLLDAQAAGLPAIASRHCDIPEEVVDGVTGLLAAEKDVDGLAAAIRRFYDMGAAEYGSFSARAVAHVSTHYDSTRTAAALRDLYAEVLARRPGVLAQPSPLQTS